MFIVSLKIYTDLHQSISNIPNIFLATEDFKYRSLVEELGAKKPEELH
jgi:hypothetical protein